MHSHDPNHQWSRTGSAVSRIERTAQDSATEGVDRWGPLTLGDAARVAKLVLTCEEHDRVPRRSTGADVKALFDPTTPHIARGAFSADGALVAFGAVHLRHEGGLTDARCSGAVHPAWRDRRIGSAMVEWQLTAARALLSQTQGTEHSRISRLCEGSAPEESDLLVRTGFTERTWYAQMRRDLSHDLPMPALAQHLRIEPWRGEWSEMIRQTSDAPEAATEDGRHLTDDDWTQMHANMVPEWSAVIVDRSTDRSRVAGYIVAARWDDEWEALGWSEGYINALGIFSPWRKQWVGQGLLTYAMKKMRDSGMEFAGIDIGSDDLEGLTELCETLGFEPTHRTILYAIDIS